jgi:hypothetical protein
MNISNFPNNPSLRNIKTTLTRRTRHPLYLITNRHAPRLQHPLIQLLLLQLRQLLIQLILIYTCGSGALRQRFGDLFAYSVLLAQVFHCLVHLVHCQPAVDRFYRVAGVFHRVERFFVDVGGLDAADFALDGHHLRGGLLELVLEGFFAAEGGFGDCEWGGGMLVCVTFFGLTFDSVVCDYRVASSHIQLQAIAR